MRELSLCAGEDFEGVLERYNKMVYRLAYARTGNSYDADDVLQEVFLRYIKAGMTYNDEEHRKAWLIRATINCSKTLLTSGWNRHRSDSELDPETDGGRDPGLEAVDTRNAVLEAVLALPAKYRTVIHLFYYEDMQIQSISKAVGISESAVKTRLHRARNLLKEKLEGVEFDV